MGLAMIEALTSIQVFMTDQFPQVWMKLLSPASRAIIDDSLYQFPKQACGTQAPLTNKWSGKYPFAQKDGVVPGSDGAGEVVAIGPKVTRFQVGAKVVTLFNQGHIGGSLDGRKLPLHPHPKRCSTA